MEILPKIKLISIIIIFLLTQQCRNKVSDKEIIDYIEDPNNGFQISKNINGVDYTCIYIPHRVIAKNFFADSLSNRVLLNKKIQELSKYMYISLKVSIDDKELLGSEFENFGQIVYELSFNMDKKVGLIYDNDTLRPLEYSCPRLYGTTQSTDMQFVFQDPRRLDNLEIQNEYFEVYIEDFGLKSGGIKFKYFYNNINTI